MSQAFVRETEEQWLHEIGPTLQALKVYLTRENNGVRVYDQRNLISPETGRPVYVMSNGLSYSLDDDGRWQML